MRDPRFKIERRKQKLSILNIFLIFLFVRCIEYYILMPYLNISSHGFISCAMGVTVMFFYQKLVFGNLKSLGLGFNPMRMSKWIGLGVLFSVCPFLIISLVEFISYRIIGTPFVFRVFAYGYTIGVHGAGAWLTAIIFCAFISVVKDTLFEALYRGLILTKLRTLYSFNMSNILQSALYSIWFLIIPVRYFIWNEPNFETKYIIKLCLFYLVFEFMCAFKWGLIARASGAVWVSLIDHIIFDFLTESLHFIKYQGDENWYLRIFMIQVVSFCFAVVYNFYRKKKRPGLFKQSRADLTDKELEEILMQKPEMIDYKEALNNNKANNARNNSPY